TRGTLNGEEFLGTLTGFCLLSERLSCDITPISTLILSYAEQENILEDGDKAAWVEKLGSALDVDLTTDPFIDESNTDAEIGNIRIFLENGVKLGEWVKTVLDLVQNGTATEDIKDFFPHANIPPVVTVATFKIAENTANGTAVGTVAVTDPDGDSLEWEITAGDDDGDFAINSSSGDITVAKALDYETTSSYSLTVQVSDGTTTGTGTITVTVTDVTEITNFTITGITDTTVAENDAFSSSTPTLGGDTSIGNITYTLSGSDAGL
ncbi:MAG: cadherin repeat domain-containing protein, partial [Gammaproteobacteria bacterium]|nr:cadherin repeat domain-containing protein [Gammaproteobacteria bacterium]